WTPDGGEAIPITGLVSLRYGKGGETTDLMSDASELVQEQPLHSIKGRISVTTLNQLHSGLGLANGVLAFDIERVKSGRGAVEGEDKTVAFNNATLKDTDSGVGSGPGENTTLAFDAAEDADGEIYTIEDAA
ncbi:MAG TPA: hypothetical protein VHX44_10965, partial [Planctomycetota bacterium]|nr:hypothetical protein [Planctomycetota bacterium]